MAKVTTAQRNVLEVMANGETIFTDYLGKFKLGNKTVNAKTLYALLDARLIQYEPMVRGVQPYSITEAGRSIVTPIAESIVETTPIVEVVEAAPVASAAVETKAVKVTAAQRNAMKVLAGKGAVVARVIISHGELTNGTLKALVNRGMIFSFNDGYQITEAGIAYCGIQDFKITRPIQRFGVGDEVTFTQPELRLSAEMLQGKVSSFRVYNEQIRYVVMLADGSQRGAYNKDLSAVESAPAASAAVETKAVKITDAQKNVLEVMANGLMIFIDYRGIFILGEKTLDAKTLYALLEARLIQYEPMVRSMEKFSITELGRSIVEAEPIN